MTNDPVQRVYALLQQRMAEASAAPADPPAPDRTARHLEEVLLAAMLDDHTDEHLQEVGAPALKQAADFGSIGMRQHGTGLVLQMADGSKYAVTIRRMHD